MKFTLSFDCDNAAFEDDLGAAIAEVLRDCAAQLEGGNKQYCLISRVVRDVNGNRIGNFSLVED